jgi:hypothetical protein
VLADELATSAKQGCAALVISATNRPQSVGSALSLYHHLVSVFSTNTVS